jgi:hypothetical protein
MTPHKLTTYILATANNVVIGAGDMLRPETPHPRPAQMPAGWTCSECEATRLVSATICADCYAVTCASCTAKGVHRIPAGERTGAPCGKAIEVAA